MFYKILLIAFAGAMGTLSRYGLTVGVQKISGSAFPWGTVVVNIFGCFLAGLIFAILEEKVHIGQEYKIIVLIGFMGAFTTFSTFILETNHLLQNSEYLMAFANILSQNLIGIAALFIGLYLGKN